MGWCYEGRICPQIESIPQAHGSDANNGRDSCARNDLGSWPSLAGMLRNDNCFTKIRLMHLQLYAYHDNSYSFKRCEFISIVILKHAG